MTLVMI